MSGREIENLLSKEWKVYLNIIIVKYTLLNMVGEQGSSNPPLKTEFNFALRNKEKAED